MKEENFEPNILAFCCNWCSYAGADLAGISRFQYPPNIKIIRVMCSGRIEPSFILKALKNGIDGVLIAGCHIGDCHYINGNEKAEKRIQLTKELMDTVGININRLRLEWISASEGQRFADTITEFVEQIKQIGKNPLKIDEEKKIPSKEINKIVNETRAYQCLECYKCTSSCPISRFDEDYSPAERVERALISTNNEIYQDNGLWQCLTCDICTKRCPSDVNYVDFIKKARTEAQKIGLKGKCAHGDTLNILQKIMTWPKLHQNRLKIFPEDLKIANKGKIMYFIGCQPYYSTLFKDIGFETEFGDIGIKTLEIAKNTVSILNSAGITPVILENERCCGHDSLWSGDFETFEKLAKINIKEIKNAKPEKIIFSCPEGYRTFKKDYSEYFNFEIEVAHTSEFFYELIENGKINLDKKIEMNVTYHDPCRLGRHLGIYEPARKIIDSIPQMKLIEMKHNRGDSICCAGPNAMLNCGSINKQIQIKRLKEARATNAKTLVTACPKCQIHLNCAMSGTMPESVGNLKIDIKDISIILAEAMGVKI